MGPPSTLNTSTEHGAAPWTTSTESCVHQAELPLRKMFEHLDGPTTGPRSYSGPISSLLKSDQLHLTPLNHHFTPLHLAEIPPLSPEVKEKMSTDPVLLQDLSQYVNTGIPGSDNPAQRKIGPLNHSRWLTHATRIERLLLSTNPDEPGAARHIDHRNILHWTHGGEVQALYN